MYIYNAFERRYTFTMKENMYRFIMHEYLAGTGR